MAGVENAAAVEQGGESDRETYEEGDGVLLDEDADVFEDAPAGVVQQGGQQQERDERDEEAAAGGLQIRVRAPVTAETEENDAEEEDGEGSFGSGESFDSALERMASISSFGVVSPKIASPVGSFPGPSVVGDPPVDMSVAQQGALMRLNQMTNGEPSLDTSFIDNSTEKEFRQRISELAESRNQSVEDASLGSIVDALLPLVLEKADPANQSDFKSEEPVNNDTPDDSATDSQGALSPMPKAILTAEDEAYLSEEDGDDSEGPAVETDTVENGDTKLDPRALDENGNGNEGDDKLEVEEVKEVEIPEEVKTQEPEQQQIPASSDSQLASELPVAVADIPKSGNGGQEEDVKDEEVFVQPETDGLEEDVASEEHAASEDGAASEYESGDEVESGDDAVGGDEADGLEDVDDQDKSPADIPEEAKKIRAMPTAKLTNEDDEAQHSEADSQEQENGGYPDEDEDAVGEEFIGDSQEDEDDEDRFEEARQEEVEDVPIKIRALPEPEAVVEKEVYEENGGSEENGDHVVEGVLPNVTADEDSEAVVKEVAEPHVITEVESEPEKEQIPIVEPDLKVLDESEVNEPQLMAVEESPSNGEEEKEAKLIDAALESVEEPPSSTTPSENIKEFSADSAKELTVSTPKLSGESNELLVSDEGKGENLDVEKTAVENVEDDKPVSLEDAEETSPKDASVEELSQSLENVNTTASKFNTESQDEALSLDGDDREDGDNGGDWDEEIEEDEDEDEEADALLESSSALAALVRAADAPAGGEADTPSLGAAGPSLPARPTRVGRSAPSLDSGPRTVQPRSVGVASTQLSTPDDTQANGEAGDGNEETREKLQVIRVKFLRLALRLGQSAHNVVVAQVLYRLGLAEQLRGGRSSSRSGAFSFDRASAIAEEQEAAGPEELDFTCTIMLLGKTGVGKSATINSIFDEAKSSTNAFKPSTSKVQEIVGHVHGIKVRVIDTPGLLPSVADQRHNEKIMASVKRFIKNSPPDIVLYFDRLDMQSRDYGDLPLLRTITDTFGAAVWFNAIVVLTHASSAPPDGPNGLPLSYEMFVAQRSHVVQQTIRQAAGDMRLMNPVSLVENHPACRMNRARQRVLPNGQVWKPQLLLLCFASKILAEANSLLKLQDNTPGRPFGARPRVPPLPFLLSSLLQSRAQLKLPDEQMGDEDESDEELEEEDSSDDEEDYDQLPPFRRLAKEEVAELDEDNRRKYFEELAERERLFQKKQWKEELKRRKEMKRRMAEAPKGGEQSQLADEGADDDMGRSAAVPVPMPDMALPPSFDADNPSHRYRYLETANQWLVRPVLETHGWDHDSGYDGFSVEKMFVVADKIPASVSGQITKDKKEANLTMECAASVKHGEGKVTLAGLDLQTIGKDLAYTLRSETRFSNFKGNKTTGGLALTLLGDTIAAGMKIEDRLIVGKRLKLVVNGGAITGRGDVAYGGSLEATLRDKDYPLSRTLTTLGLSIMDWHGDLAIGGNLQSQMVVGKTMMVGRANLNNRGAGQISIRASSSEQLQMALIGLLPIIRSLANRLLFSQSQQ